MEKDPSADMNTQWQEEKTVVDVDQQTKSGNKHFYLDNNAEINDTITNKTSVAVPRENKPSNKFSQRKARAESPKKTKPNMQTKLKQNKL